MPLAPPVGANGLYGSGGGVLPLVPLDPPWGLYGSATGGAIAMPAGWARGGPVRSSPSEGGESGPAGRGGSRGFSPPSADPPAEPSGVDPAPPPTMGGGEAGVGPEPPPDTPPIGAGGAPRGGFCSIGTVGAGFAAEGASARGCVAGGAFGGISNFTPTMPTSRLAIAPAVTPAWRRVSVNPNNANSFVRRPGGSGIGGGVDAAGATSTCGGSGLMGIGSGFRGIGFKPTTGGLSGMSAVMASLIREPPV